MRLITIILSLFLCTIITQGFCTVRALLTDTVKHVVKKHHNKHYNWPMAKRSLPPDKIYYNDCVFTHQYTTLQRLQKYPFSKAAKILAVSYDGDGEPNFDILTNGDTIDAVTNKKIVNYKPHGLLFKNDTLDHSSLFEIKKPTSEQINRLTNLMFNTDTKVHYNHNKYDNPGSACFNPRNAFIFYDKNGKVFDYIEMCFECQRYESKSGKIYVCSGCNQELDNIKMFLIDLGIKYGTLTTNDSDMKQ